MKCLHHKITAVNACKLSVLMLFLPQQFLLGAVKTGGLDNPDIHFFFFESKENIYLQT